MLINIKTTIKREVYIIKGRNPTADESRYMTWVRSQGCWCCNEMGIENREEDILIHHTEGKTKPNAHFLTIGLCNGHHARDVPEGLHKNPTEWESKWGKQEDIVDYLRGEYDSNRV